MLKSVFLFLAIVLSFSTRAQLNEVPYDHVISNSELIDLLDENNEDLREIQQLYRKGKTDLALEKLTSYFKEQFSNRYFFDWKNFPVRFAEYNQMYSGRESYHAKKAQEHLDLYPASTQWKIPFNNLKGEEVTSYPYRHLTRQHKAGDIALLYFYKNDINLVNYIPEQAKSLNLAFNQGLVETIEDGNGAFEAYRAGNRMFNWLFAHQCLLASKDYSWQQQLEMIRTFIHTGAQLYHFNPEYNEGNHQTRGMSALAMLAFLFPEIQGADQWKVRSLQRLEEHLEQEIYADGFQFERSVHYHIDDIENYFYPWQMAQINQIKLNPIWDTRIKGLFDVMMQIAMPNKKAPVFQDDTDSPWAEFNEIGNTMALGTALIGEPAYKYFASSKVSSTDYWFLRPEQLSNLKTVKKEEPKVGSCELPQTGYYIMRQGWDDEDLYMAISAGLSPQKPDHQHGDMLGVQAYAYGNMLLSNYQVRYYLKDLAEFKNSWVKNVLLIDSIPHGRDWSGNTGGSGFGKWAKLPTPSVISWVKTPVMDLFVGTHDGYNDIGAETSRSVIFMKDGFWLVNDVVSATEPGHTAQQIWQGHYDVEKENTHIRSVFPNGAGLEIIQLGDSADEILKSSVRSKGRAVFTKQFQQQANLITLLFPFEDFDERLDEIAFDNFSVKGWKIYSSSHCPSSIRTDAQVIVSKKENFLFMDASEIEVKGTRISIENQKTNLWIVANGEKSSITNCGNKPASIRFGNERLTIKPGELIQTKL
ncbi:heparinase II/III family protein [Mangrovibacterium sp.]|uniref:heparinase II/III family protein n=1 Tax=Mangrovibacterium sp. TaxID=1961364 RepID=UPI003563708C